MNYRLFALLLLVLPAQAESLTIMAFNVENLFDATHDPGKNDETYLPSSEKKSRSHIDKCNKVKVKRWREQCLNWDWNEKIVELVDV